MSTKIIRNPNTPEVVYIINRQIGESLATKTYLVYSQVFDPLTKLPIVTEYTCKIINLVKMRQLGFDPEHVIASTARLAALGSSPVCDKYIACVYDTFVTNLGGDRCIIVITEYIPGTTLTELIREQALSNSVFDTKTLLSTATQIVDALVFMHEHGIAHQNLKPSNIVFDSKHNRFRIIDFVYSCNAEWNDSCISTAGQVYYMPPEIITGSGNASFDERKKHDIWSLGVVLYELANLSNDYMDFTDPTNPKAVANEIVSKSVRPSHGPYQPLNSIIDVMLSKGPEDRPTADQVAVLLKLAQPGCKAGGKFYPDADPDFCLGLIKNMEKCTIGNSEYSENTLKETARVLGLQLPPGGVGDGLCATVTAAVSAMTEETKNKLTDKVIAGIETLAKMELISGGQTNAQIANLVQTTSKLYEIAKDLGLLNAARIKTRQEELTLRSQIYQASNPIYSAIDRSSAAKLARVLGDLI